MSDNSKRKTWPSRRRKLKWSPAASIENPESRYYQETVAGRRTRRPCRIFVALTSGLVGESLADQWIWGEVGEVSRHSPVATEAEAKRLAEKEYHDWQKPTRYETIQEPSQEASHRA